MYSLIGVALIQQSELLNLCTGRFGFLIVHLPQNYRHLCAGCYMNDVLFLGVLSHVARVSVPGDAEPSSISTMGDPILENAPIRMVSHGLRAPTTRQVYPCSFGITFIF